MIDQDIKQVVSQQLKAIRKDKGLTQKQVAERLGITEASYNRYESGANLTIEKVQEIAVALGMTKFTIHFE